MSRNALQCAQGNVVGTWAIPSWCGWVHFKVLTSCSQYCSRSVQLVKSWGLSWATFHSLSKSTGSSPSSSSSPSTTGMVYGAVASTASIIVPSASSEAWFSGLGATKASESPSSPVNQCLSVTMFKLEVFNNGKQNNISCADFSTLTNIRYLFTLFKRWALPKFQNVHVQRAVKLP